MVRVLVLSTMGIGFCAIANAGALTVPSANALTANLAQLSPSKSAKQFLKASAAELNLDANLNDLRVESVSESPIGHHVRFVQSKAGVPIDHAGIVVTLSHQNEVLSFVNDYAISAESSNISPRFDLPAVRAQEIAYEHLKLTASPTREEIVEKVLVVDGTPHSVYQINLSAPVDKLWSWEVLIDASTGQIHRSVSRAYDARKGGGGSKIRTVRVGANVLDPNPTIKTNRAYGATEDFKDLENADSAFFNRMMTYAGISVQEHKGVYKLQNSYVTLTDQELPKNPDCSSTTGSFDLKRSDPCFDMVNAYYFISNSLEYLNEYLEIDARPLKYSGAFHIDAHGVEGDDNSHYDSQTDELAFGEGGVDDAQDHEVVLHELGHAIHNWVTNGHMSQVEGLSEGIGDYWAASYSRTMMRRGHIAYNWTFSFDGHNEFWPGRHLSVPGKYPAAAQGEIHDAGQLWASVCMEIWESIGKYRMDRIFWSGISMLNEKSNQLDAAKAVLLAAQKLYPHEPRTIATVRQKFLDRGYSVP